MLNSFVISLGKGIGIGIGIWDWYYLIVLDSLNPLLTTVGTFGTFGCILCVVSMQLATVISLGFYPSHPPFPSSTPRRHFRHFSPLASQLFLPLGTHTHIRLAISMHFRDFISHCRCCWRFPFAMACLAGFPSLISPT